MLRDTDKGQLAAWSGLCSTWTGPPPCPIAPKQAGTYAPYICRGTMGPVGPFLASGFSGAFLWGGLLMATLMTLSLMVMPSIFKTACEAWDSLSYSTYARP